MADKFLNKDGVKTLWSAVKARDEAVENEFVDGTKKVKSAETADKANSVAWVGVTDKPAIPTKVSQLENDKKYVNNAEVMNRYYLGIPNKRTATYKYFRIAHLHFTGAHGETAVVNVTINHGWNFSENQHASYRIEIHSDYDHPGNGTNMGVLIMRMQTTGGGYDCCFYVVWTAPAICDLYVDISKSANEWHSATAMVFGNLQSDSNTVVVGVDSIPTAGSDGYPYVSCALTAYNLATKADLPVVARGNFSATIGLKVNDSVDTSITFPSTGNWDVVATSGTGYVVMSVISLTTSGCTIRGTRWRDDHLFEKNETINVHWIAIRY